MEPVFQGTSLHSLVDFSGNSMVRNVPVMQETLGQGDPLEKGMATHSSILA